MLALRTCLRVLLSAEVATVGLGDGGDCVVTTNVNEEVRTSAQEWARHRFCSLSSSAILKYPAQNIIPQDYDTAF